MKIECPNCKHSWNSKSHLGIVKCASCGQRIKTKHFKQKARKNGNKDK